MTNEEAINELKSYIPKDNGYNTKDIEAFNMAISALENIDNLEEEFNKFQEEYELLSKDFITVCEENENKWFLCYEKLPKENGMYLTTYFRKTKVDFIYPKEEIVVKITRFLNGEWKLPAFVDPEIEKAIYQKIIAWQPLPNPFIEKRTQMSKINLSTYIKSRRQNIGLTQKQLAELVGVTDVTISRWESGQREPVASDFLRLCELLGMELEWFIGEENENDV